MGNSETALMGTNILFGSKQSWNEDDLLAYATNEQIQGNSLLIDINMEYKARDVIDDISGNQNIGMLIGDYEVEFDAGTRKPRARAMKLTPKIEKEERAY